MMKTKMLAATIALGTMISLPTVAFADDTTNGTSTVTVTSGADNNTATTSGNTTSTTDNGTSTSDNGTSTADNSTSPSNTDSNTTSNGTDATSTGNTADNGTGGSAPSQPTIDSSYLTFVTAVTQGISVALANNDTQKAQLLVQYGIDNIEKANQLIAQGKTDDANQLLTSAVDFQNLATDASQTSDSTTKTEIHTHIANNVVALATALQHVSNPHAQAMLRKNIEKGLEHLQKKLGKLPVVLTPTTGAGTGTTTSGTSTTGSSTQTGGTVSWEHGNGKDHKGSSTGTQTTGTTSTGTSTTVTNEPSDNNDEDAPGNIPNNIVNAPWTSGHDGESNHGGDQEHGNGHGQGNGHGNGHH